MGEYPRIRVSGTPGERGEAYGTQARERIARSLSGYAQAFQYYTGWDWARVREEAVRFVPAVTGSCPAYAEEMRGIATGAGAGFEDILALNVRTEIMFAARAREAMAQRERMAGECTAFAVAPHASATGHTLLGQNWDWLLHCFDTVVVLEVEQPDRPNFVTVVEAGLLAKTGLNSAGLGLATNALVSEHDRGQPGLPYHVLLRALFDCETIAGALAVLRRGIRASSANYLLGSAGGTVLDVEAAPGGASQLFPVHPDRGLLLHTNNFLAPPATTADLSPWAMPDSAARLGRIRALARLGGPPWPVELFQSALADHAGFPGAICCHPDPGEHLLRRGATVASVLMDLGTRRLWLADGNPCTAPYRCLDYGDFLGGPSPSGRSPGGQEAAVSP